MTGPVVLRGDVQRNYACNLIMGADQNSVVNIASPRRSRLQNAKMWAMLTDVARARPAGRQWTKEAWKAAFMHSLGHEIEFGQALDGKGFFPVGFKSSQLTVGQMRDLIECIYEYGSRHGVEWRETERNGFEVTV